MLDSILEFVGLSPKRKKRVYRWKLVFRGKVISRHYTKSSALKSKKIWQTILPINAPVKSRSKALARYSKRKVKSSYSYAKKPYNNRKSRR